MLSNPDPSDVSILKKEIKTLKKENYKMKSDISCLSDVYKTNKELNEQNKALNKELEDVYKTIRLLNYLRNRIESHLIMILDYLDPSEVLRESILTCISNSKNLDVSNPWLVKYKP